jgi:hypothetical protein
MHLLRFTSSDYMMQYSNNTFALEVLEAVRCYRYTLGHWGTGALEFRLGTGTKSTKSTKTHKVPLS